MSSTTSTTPVHESNRRRRTPGWHRAVSPITLLALWQTASSTGLLPPDKLDSPAAIFESLTRLWSEGELQDAVAVSGQRVLLGFTIGATVGVVLAVLAGLSRLGENAIDPPMQMLRTVPHLGLLPLLVLWFGIDETPKVAIIALGVSFPLYVNTYAGVRGVDQKFLDAARVLGLSQWERLRQVVLPAALPSALVGLRLSLGVAWLTLIVAEQINTTSGIGFIVMDAASFNRTGEMVGGLLIYSSLGLLTDSLVRYIERKALAWRTG
ncbi:ABC transporter permease [Aeromicrobium sp. CTD01-1L150]|uniref:ABC transporter permease n=1 Tax=Aeromicrobium sp. CTD01-1L150 TaxID=3341830 RepID=UPI0035C0225F